MDRKIEELIHRAIGERTFPGAVVGYIAYGRRVIIPVGRLTYKAHSPAVTDNTVYDIASVTKAIPVSSIVLSLIEQGRLGLGDKVIEFIPEIISSDRSKILIKHLLTYTMAFKMPQRLSAYAKEGGDALLKDLFSAQLQSPPGQEYCYSNAPAILMGLIAERVLNKPLDVIADELFFEPLKMNNTTFHPEKLSGVSIAPTEMNWRGQVKGVVHDEAAWVLRATGVIGGNAGVFSCVNDLLIFCEMLLGNGEYGGRKYLKPETVVAMHTNQIADIGGCVGLGWDLNQRYFMGNTASSVCFGKAGYTGPMIIVDPVKQRAAVLLTNRTYPQRPQDGTAINSFRRELGDIIFG